MRAIAVDAPAAGLFRRLCQLKVAPSSYDWLDHGGRRSPHGLTPGAEQLALGQRFLVCAIIDFAVAQHITRVAPPRIARLFGPLAVSSWIAPRGSECCRLVVKLSAGATGWWQRVRHDALAWGTCS